MIHRYTIFLIALVMVLSAPALADNHEGLVGSVTDVEGAVTIVRGDEVIAAEKGTRLYKSDVIQTNDAGGVGIVLRDDTTLSLGPSSELAMSKFEFQPDEGILGMTLSMAKGTLVYISGQIAKLAPGSAEIETPAGVAAVRGTKLLIEVNPSKKATKKARS